MNLNRIIKKFLKIAQGHEKNEYEPYLQSYTSEKEFTRPTKLSEIKKNLIVWSEK